MLKIIPIIIFIWLPSCSFIGDTTYGAKHLSAQDVQALKEATSDWNRACGLELKTVLNNTGDVYIIRTKFPINCNSKSAIGCTHSINSEAKFIEIASEPGFATRQTLAHEIGHSLGLKHKNYGIMRPEVPVEKGQIVSIKDCGDW